MTYDIALSLVWTALNSPVGITAVASVALWVLNKVYAWRPEWQAYEGAIIKGIQWAEREIPDGSENKYMLRADLALQYALKAYERMNDKRADARMREQLAMGVEIVRSDLEASGVL